MAQGAAADEGFTHFLHGDGRKHARGVTQLFQHILHGQRVEHCGQHAHVVGGRTFHALGRAGKPAKNIAPANYKGHFDAHFEHGADFTADGGYGFRVNAGLVFSGQGLAAQLEQHALVFQCGHESALVKAEVLRASPDAGKRLEFGPAPKRKNCNRICAQLKVFLRQQSRPVLERPAQMLQTQPESVDYACLGHSSTVKGRLWAIWPRASRASRSLWGE